MGTAFRPGMPQSLFETGITTLLERFGVSGGGKRSPGSDAGRGEGRPSGDGSVELAGGGEEIAWRWLLATSSDVPNHLAA